LPWDGSGDGGAEDLWMKEEEEVMKRKREKEKTTGERNTSSN
jgi:hypothetical protein